MAEEDTGGGVVGDKGEVGDKPGRRLFRPAAFEEGACPLPERRGVFGVSCKRLVKGTYRLRVHPHPHERQPVFKPDHRVVRAKNLGFFEAAVGVGGVPFSQVGIAQGNPGIRVVLVAFK